MRQSTIALQVICVVLGFIFVATGLFLADRVLEGGLIFGSLMFVFATFLGADHTTNAGPSRYVFKWLAVVSTLPILVFGSHSLVLSATQSNWFEVLLTLLKLLVVVAVLIVVAIDTTSRGQRILSHIGLDRPAKDEK